MISPNSWSASFYKKPLKIEGVILGDTVEGQGNELLLFRRHPVLALQQPDGSLDFNFVCLKQGNDIQHHPQLMMRWRRWNLLRNGTPQGARCNLGKWAQSEPDADDVAPLSDDEAEAVNRALASLKVKYPDAYQAVMVRYHDGVSNKQAAARQCGTSVTAMYRSLLAGHAFLDGSVVRQEVNHGKRKNGA